jgi:putative (di)nucleoside polyphosphate hydrolase
MSASRCSNAQGRVLIGHRFKGDGPEIILPGLDWQMPQGGVDEARNARTRRCASSGKRPGRCRRYLGETDWLTYEFPAYDGPQTHRLAKFRGQRQKWFALRFTGRDDEIDPLTPRNDQPAEFDAWRWERLDRVADLVVPFRREVYQPWRSSSRPSRTKTRNNPMHSRGGLTFGDFAGDLRVGITILSSLPARGEGTYRRRGTSRA